MISCTEFIPAYSELFKFIENEGGKEAVEEFWHYLSDSYLGSLKEMVQEHGVRGCWLYFSQALNEEAADFRMEFDEEADELTITMRYCPSKGRLLENEQIEPYHDYCRHCDVLYRRVLEPLGLEHILDLSECDKARCSEIIRRRPS